MDPNQEKIQQFREHKSQEAKENTLANEAKRNADGISSAVSRSTDKVVSQIAQDSQITSQTGSKVVDAVNESGKKVIDSLAGAQGDIAQALNNLVVATVVSKDPQLLQASRDVAVLLRSIASAGDSFKGSKLNLLPSANEKLALSIEKLSRGLVEKPDKDYTVHLEGIQQQLSELDIKPIINLPKTDVNIDLKPLIDAIQEVRTEVKKNKIDIPITNMNKVVDGLKSVQETISSLSFPVPNYVLPFKDINGKAAQVQLDSSGNIPTTGGGGSGGTQYVEGVTTAPATGNAFLARYNSTLPTLTNGQLNTPQLDTRGGLQIVVTDKDGTGGAVVGSQATNIVTNVNGLQTRSTLYGQFDDVTPGALTEDRLGIQRMSANRNAYTTIRDAAGNERGANVNASGQLSVSYDNADIAPSTQNITVIDSSSSTATGANGQSVIIGTPTAGSAATFALSTIETVRIMVTGIWTGTITAEQSLDTGTTWTTIGVHQGAYTTSSFTAGFVGGANVAGATMFRMRATATITGTAVVKVIESLNTQSVYIANAPPSGTVVSILNSSSTTLTSGSIFTGTGEDVTNFSEMRVSVFSDVASATDGLSLQQSSNGTNWDITDTYTVSLSAAGAGKTYVIPRQARFFRVVYTNGGTNQASFRLQTILNRTATAPSSQRATDAYTNETDLVQNQVFPMGFNGTTWDRLRTTGTGVLTVSSVTTAQVPGVGATNLGKAEDAAHASGDTGVLALSVANEALTNISGTDGDYTIIGSDRNGTIHVAQKASTATLSNVSTSGTSATLLSANAARIGAQITNEAATVLYIKFGTTASATSYTVVLAGAASAPFSYYEVPAGYTGRIDAILASSTGTARVTEITP